ncbi:WXG100 family type VII secretion target [Nocardia asteroides]|uniref:WXG100 family type VII secretion target n=1 Tax=Nocardia asteroides TaxID=1824 RepID=UPI001E53A4C5|nr:WXG100 family type VII secretion target [Nocardia asteroides]UGT60034.1 WXG100 family type VII secretion target [Nocardia asteroides]
MSDIVGIDQGRARQATADVEAVVNGMRSTLSRIQTIVDSARDGWRGTANGAFESASVRWNDEGRRLNTLLDEMTVKLHQANSQYGRMEEDSAPGFNLNV